MEVQADDQVYVDHPLQGVQRPETRITKTPTGYTDNLEEKNTDGSRKLLPDTTTPYKVQSVTDSTVAIY